jgi:hypothetical protein
MTITVAYYRCSTRQHFVAADSVYPPPPILLEAFDDLATDPKSSVIGLPLTPFMNYDLSARGGPRNMLLSDAL